MSSDFAVTADGMCHRTHAALILSLPEVSLAKFSKFLAGLYDGLDEQVRVNEVFSDVCQALKAESYDAIACLSFAVSEDNARACAAASIVQRWRQACALLEAASKRV